jgi:histidine ammonia-lyase
MLAYELLAGITAVRMREQTPGDGVAAVVEYFAASIAPFEQDRSPAADIETILQHFNSAEFTSLSH